MKHDATRLPELGGMTEAGFNRVVAMIRFNHFVPPHDCTLGWVRSACWNAGVSAYTGAYAGCDICQRSIDDWKEWRASLPRVRNKRQRKASKRRFFNPVLGVPFEFTDEQAAELERPEYYSKDKPPEPAHTSASAPPQSADPPRTAR